MSALNSAYAIETGSQLFPSDHPSTTPRQILASSPSLKLPYGVDRVYTLYVANNKVRCPQHGYGLEFGLTPTANQLHDRLAEYIIH